MVRRLNPEMWEWQSIASIGAFALTLAVFLFFIVRALRLKKDVASHMGNLPLDDEPSAARDHE
jgi:heme/copper-type cytochrome/quinol oxidase subunit 1